MRKRMSGWTHLMLLIGLVAALLPALSVSAAAAFAGWGVD
jgi:hypothetical protein